MRGGNQLAKFNKMFQRARLPVTVVAVALMATITLQHLASKGASPNLSADKFEQIMSADPTRSIVYGWPEWPVQIFVSGDLGIQTMDDVERVLAEINNIAGLTVAATGQNEDTALIHVILSDVGHTRFEEHYSEFFKTRFGDAEFDKWDAIGGFQFPFKPQHPCFGFGLYDPEDFAIPGYVATHSPYLGMTSIGNLSVDNWTNLEWCLREELAHLIFFIPDYPVEDADESIFNSNPVHGAREDFSGQDKELLRFLAIHRVRNQPIGAVVELFKQTNE